MRIARHVGKTGMRIGSVDRNGPIQGYYAPPDVPQYARGTPLLDLKADIIETLGLTGNNDHDHIVGQVIDLLYRDRGLQAYLYFLGEEQNGKT